MLDLVAQALETRQREQLAEAVIEDEPLDQSGLAAIKANRTEGECLFCEGRTAKVTCGAPECIKSYQRAWHRDAMKAHPERYGDAFYRAKKRRLAGG